MSLLDDLKAAEKGREYGCSVCEAISRLEGAEREALTEAARPGKLSMRSLIAISQSHDLGIGRAGIIKHRNEDHQP